jgi:hypothetical protein
MASSTVARALGILTPAGGLLFCRARTAFEQSHEPGRGLELDLGCVEGACGDRSFGVLEQLFD